MNRSILETELKKVGINVRGWLPVLECDACRERWEPFNVAVGGSSPTLRLDYWRCPNKCNAGRKASREILTATPKYVVIDDIPGMIFGDEDLPDFQRYVRSMDATEVPNRS